MKITDKKALSLIRRANCLGVTYNIESFPEEERNGSSDIEIVRDEIAYFVDMYEEDGNVYYYDLQEARRILRETSNGKYIPITPDYRLKYSKADIKRAKNEVNRYRRLKRILEEV